MYSNVLEAPTGGGVALGATLTAATETVVMVSGEGALPPQAQGVVVRGRVNATSGATGGAWTVKARRGALVGGAQIGATQTITFAATTTADFPYSFVDSTGPAASGQYCVTVTAVGSNGVFNDGQVEVMVPVPGGVDA